MSDFTKERALLHQDSVSWLQASFHSSFFLIVSINILDSNCYVYGCDVGGKYSTHERNENSCSILLGKLENDISLGRLIINVTLGEWDKMMWQDYFVSGQEPVGLSSDCGNKHSRFLKLGNFPKKNMALHLVATNTLLWTSLRMSYFSGLSLSTPLLTFFAGNFMYKIICS